MLPPFLVPLLFAVLGAALYLSSTPGPNGPKWARLGELACFAGLLWLVYLLAFEVHGGPLFGR